MHYPLLQPPFPWKKESKLSQQIVEQFPAMPKLSKVWSVPIILIAAWPLLTQTTTIYRAKWVLRFGSVGGTGMIEKSGVKGPQRRLFSNHIWRHRIGWTSKIWLMKQEHIIWNGYRRKWYIFDLIHNSNMNLKCWEGCWLSDLCLLWKTKLLIARLACSE